MKTYAAFTKRPHKPTWRAPGSLPGEPEESMWYMPILLITDVPDDREVTREMISEKYHLGDFNRPWANCFLVPLANQEEVEVVKSRLGLFETPIDWKWDDTQAARSAISFASLL